MNKIALARIDDRLIHGQILTSWVKSTNTNHIVIIDNKLVTDMFTQRILKAAAPKDIKVDIVNEVDSIELLKQNSNKNIIILTKTPTPFEYLLDQGIEIKEINLGGMGLKDDRVKFNKNVSANQQEVDSMKRLIDRGVSMYYQMLPVESAVDVRKILKERE